MGRLSVLFPLLLLLLLLLSVRSLGLRRALLLRPGCAPCRPESCLASARCPVPGILARDECGCCTRCPGAEGASCGGLSGARCGPGLVCASNSAGSGPEGSGLCVCSQRGPVCGSDGRSYPSVCALRLRARLALRLRPGHLHKARDGPCQLGEWSTAPTGLARAGKVGPRQSTILPAGTPMTGLQVARWSKLQGQESPPSRAHRDKYRGDSGNLGNLFFLCCCRSISSCLLTLPLGPDAGVDLLATAFVRDLRMQQWAQPGRIVGLESVGEVKTPKEEREKKHV